jgi:hypothetical protein
LKPDSDKRSVRAKRELAGKPATGWNLLKPRKAARGGVNREVDEGVGDDGSTVVRVEVRYLKRILVARRNDDEVLVGLLNFLKQRTC